MATNPNDNSIAGLLGQLTTSIPELFRKEVQLFRAEMGEKVNQAATALGLIAGGIVMALVALHVLAAALVNALVELGLEPGWAALIVGALIALLAYLAVQKGANDLKAANLAPKKSARSLQRDAELAKETVR